MFQNPGHHDFGGGFGNSSFNTSVGDFGSPSVGVDRPKKFRFQNITPVTAAHIREMTYDGSLFKLGEADISQVTIVGTIISVEKSQTCTSYKVDDTTGIVVVKHWSSFDNEEDSIGEIEELLLEEGMPIRVFAQVRSFQKNVNLNALNIRVVEDLNELTVHMLECIKFKLVNEAKQRRRHMTRLGGDMNSQAFQSVGFNQPVAMMGMGMDNVQTQVWKLVESAQHPAGMSVSEIRSTLKNLNVNQIKQLQTVNVIDWIYINVSKL